MMAYSSSKIKTGLPGEDIPKIRENYGRIFGESPTMRRLEDTEDCVVDHKFIPREYWVDNNCEENLSASVNISGPMCR